MKKELLSFAVLVLMIFFLHCAGTDKSDMEIINCKSSCRTAYDGCVKKAIKKKNEAKKAACDAVLVKCSTDCEKK